MDSNAPSRIVLLWFVCAYILLTVWFYLAGYSAAFVERETLLGGITPARLTFFLTFILTNIGAVLFPHRLELSVLRLGLALPLLLLVGTGMLVISAYQSLLPLQVLASMGCVIMGTSYALLTMSVKSCMMQGTPLKTLVAAFIIIYIISNLIYSGAFIATDHRQQMLWVLLAPMLIAVCCYYCLRFMRENQNFLQLSSADQKQGSKLLPFISMYRTQLSSLAAVSITIVLLRAISTGGIWGGGAYLMDGISLSSWIVQILSAVVFLAVSLPTFLLYAKQSTPFKLVLPFLVLIALLLLLVATRGWATIPGFNMVMERFCQLLQSMVLAVAVKSMPLHPYRTVGALAAVNYTLALLWMLFFEGLAYEISTVVLLLCYASVITIVLVRHGQSALILQDRLEDESGDALIQEILDIKTRNLAKTYRLTDREAEILLYLARGRSIPYVQQQLYLANGTVKTHVKHIYKKLGVHTRQDLLNLFQDGQDAP
jgi:DNA-binding CsgD family transcriptional regulator